MLQHNVFIDKLHLFFISILRDTEPIRICKNDVIKCESDGY